jgi:hypothetical protein
MSASLFNSKITVFLAELQSRGGTAAKPYHLSVLISLAETNAPLKLISQARK